MDTSSLNHCFTRWGTWARVLSPQIICGRSTGPRVSALQLLVTVIDWFLPSSYSSTYIIPQPADRRPGMALRVTLISTAAGKLTATVELKSPALTVEIPVQAYNRREATNQAFYSEEAACWVIRTTPGTTEAVAMADALDHLSSGSTRIEWLSSLNTEFTPKKNYRRTSIICTIGTYGILWRTLHNCWP